MKEFWFEGSQGKGTGKQLETRSRVASTLKKIACWYQSM
jgi:hypothetical protein